ncbi:MAG TPA: NADH-quinone oxidoreductase subunit N [Thermoplasmata archaeon]|nr:NADH-quinone oxidoreductase subunit N [Thermoplasmata archaeon]
MELTAFVGPWVPELIVLAAGLLVLLLDVLGVRASEVGGGIAAAGSALALLFVTADLGWAPLAALRTLPGGRLDVVAASTTSLFGFTSLGLVFQAVFLIATVLVALAAASRPRDDRGAPIFFGLLLFATLGMLLVAVAADLIFLLLAIEVTSISTYVMVGYTRRDVRSLEAAMKFYIIGALSSTLSFFGASFLFGAFGTTNLYAIRAILRAGPFGFPVLALLGFGFVIAGLAFKTTLVPFHAWAVDVYDGAPSEVSAYLAGASKKLGVLAFFLVFVGPILYLGPGSSNLFSGGPVDLGGILAITFGVLAVATMTFGNVLALLQKEMKRMLAYSSISQAGYLFLGIAIGTAPAFAGATLQVFAHVFMKTGAFLVVAAAASIGVGPLIDDWRGVGARRPWFSVAFALMLLSLAGVPLTVGFVSKFVLFSAAVQAQGLYVWLAVAGLLNSALSLFYYGRVLKVIFFDPAPATEPIPAGAVVGGSGPAPLPWGGLGYGRGAAIAVAAVAIVALGVYPQPVLGAIQSAASHFLLAGA